MFSNSFACSTISLKNSITKDYVYIHTYMYIYTYIFIYTYTYINKTSNKKYTKFDIDKNI